MAIFIASTKSISRGKGQSAVASASYRAGVELQDEKYGKKHDYSNRFGVMSADIILPSSLKNQNVSIERDELWNKAEKAENRKDARVAREWLVNLPYELDEQQRKELAHNFAQELADRYGVIADCAIHEPTQKEIERGADARNFHAHIMLTTRKAELNDNNEIVLTDKSTAELSDKKRRELGLERMSEEVKAVRQLWERVANEKLAEHDIELIDSRSYKDRQLDIEPQLKMGSVATKKERDKYERELKKAKQAQQKGKHYEIDNTPVTVAGQINAMIKERNELVFNSRKREQKNDRLRTAIERAITAIERASRSNDVAERNRAVTAERIVDSEHQAEETKQAVAGSQRAITARTIPTPNPFADRRTASVDKREQATAELVKQQRRVADATRRVDRNARRYKYEDERVAEAVERVKLKIAGKLLRRKNDDSRVRWERNETVEDYPHKYDQRQMQLLDEFEKSIGLDNKKIGFLERVSSFKSMINSDFIEQHSDMIQLINDPNAEREQYNERLTGFVQFREQLDSKRDGFNNSLIEKMGGLAGEVGRMTRDIISSFSYMQALDSFIADDTQTADARELAEQHRADTLDRTCQQFKYAYFDVLRLPDNQRGKYVHALKSSLDTFQLAYRAELSVEQNKALQDGLRAFENDLARNQSYSIRMNR